MKSAIFSLLPVRRGSTIASIRIGCWLSDHLEIPLLDDERILQQGDLDNLFIVNGSTLYCKHLSEVAESVRGAKNVIWVQNDYTLPPPKDVSKAESPFRRAFADRKLVPHYWTTCEANAENTPKSGWVNWNSLAFKKGLIAPGLGLRKTIYYGAYREDRASSFSEMLSIADDLGLEISSTSAKFPADRLVPPFRGDLYASLAGYGMGIYAHDKKSRHGRHSPATRFYEMLSVGLPIAFMPDCVDTLGQYGYDVSPFVLSRHSLDKRWEWAEMQRAWRADFETRVARKVDSLYAALDE